MRINKYIAASGFCSRRKADKLVEDGLVMIDGSRAKPGDSVHEGQTVLVDGVPIEIKTEKTYIAFHKPEGVISTADPEAHNTIYDYVDVPERVFYIGRLDVPSSGLMILTDDGELSQKLSHPSFDHEKEYVVKVDKPITRRIRTGFEQGIEIDGDLTKPAHFKKLGVKSFRLILTEGRRRQIRRMAEALGYEVVSLKRTRIGSVRLRDLGPGNWRQLSKKERRELLGYAGL
jgi:23S rRNA pseudouridine2604 synthase